MLFALGWGDDFLPQVNADPKGREAVPDCLLFATPAKRPPPCLRRKTSAATATAWSFWRPSAGCARSRAEEFLEIDLAAALGLPGIQHGFDEAEPRHALRLFFLFFQRSAFLPQAWDDSGSTFHAYALNEARLYEDKSFAGPGRAGFRRHFSAAFRCAGARRLGRRTYTTGYGQFKRPRFTPDYLDKVREAALVLLYRLLFLFYAEDRNLPPARDARYAPYSVRRLREGVRDKVDAGTKFSRTMQPI